MRSSCCTPILAVAVLTLAAMVGPIAAGETAPAAAAPAAATTEPAAVADDMLPYVYTKWEHYTTKNGLPNDHVFAIQAQGNYVWIGTEEGLARLDKRNGEIRTWNEKDGLPWRVVSSIAADPVTGDVWLGLFGGGLARLSGGRFDHWHQLNSGLVNDVVYGVCLDGDDVWAATTAGASRFRVKSGQWTQFTEKNAPMEEIWNYGCAVGGGKVFLSVWGSGLLEYDTATDHWKDYLDPDGEMEIDLYRDDGIVHVITTGVSWVDDVVWVTTYFGASRYDGRHWRGYFDKDSGTPSNFNNAVAGRSANEAWFGTDKGLGVLADYPTDTWVVYTMDPDTHAGKAVIKRGTRELGTVTMPRAVPHDYILWVAFDGNDAWIGTSKGVGHAIGEGYYPGLRPKPSQTAER